MDSTRRLLLLLFVATLVAGWAGVARRTSLQERNDAGSSIVEHSSVTLSSAEACLDAGYLCAILQEEDSFRILRWPDGVTVLRIDIAAPPVPDPGQARDLQQAAIRGILAWQDTPLRLVVNERRGEAPDIQVTWTDSVGGTRLGETRVEWQEVQGVVTFRVPRFILGTLSASTGGALSPQDVELIALHEMGHALGLPHSDSPSDVMFPEKTARFLTARDHRTAEALYRLPTGALVRTAEK